MPSDIDESDCEARPPTVKKYHRCNIRRRETRKLSGQLSARKSSLGTPEHLKEFPEPTRKSDQLWIFKKL